MREPEVGARGADPASAQSGRRTRSSKSETSARSVRGPCTRSSDVGLAISERSRSFSSAAAPSQRSGPAGELNFSGRTETRGAMPPSQRSARKGASRNFDSLSSASGRARVRRASINPSCAGRADASRAGVSRTSRCESRAGESSCRTGSPDDLCLSAEKLARQSFVRSAREGRRRVELRPAHQPPRHRRSPGAPSRGPLFPPRHAVWERRLCAVGAAKTPAEPHWYKVNREAGLARHRRVRAVRRPVSFLGP